MKDKIILSLQPIESCEMYLGGKKAAIAPPEVIHNLKLTLGEGPFWDAKNKLLWLIDGLSEHGRGDDLYCIDMTTQEVKSWHIGKHLGCAIPSRDGRVLLNLQDGICLFDPVTEQLEELSDLERDIENNRLNDGKCDSTGRLWFGSMSMTANQPDREFEITGSFYKMEADGTTKKFFDGVGISNGIAWNKDETRMYYVDTTPQAVYAFDFDVTCGEITNRTKIIDIDISEGSPDGMCMDAEGMIWVAHFGGWKVSRWNPETGERLGEIRLPCAQVTCPTFGGENLDTLYITTASIGLTEEERKAQPLAGCTFAVKPGVKGVLPHDFPGKR